MPFRLGGRVYRITVKPKVCVSTPQGNGKPSKEVLGGGSLLCNVSSVGDGLTNGVDCCYGVLSKAPESFSYNWNEVYASR